MSCFSYAGWCKDIGSYCSGVPTGGKCSKSDCFGKKPPQGGSAPVTTTTVYPCQATTATSAPTSSSTTSKCPIPTATNICTQPYSRQYGYGPGNSVGGIDLPIVTCNDVQPDYEAGNQLKLYTNKDTSKCSTYRRPQCSNACADACKSQFDQCSATYAQGCKSNSNGKPKWYAARAVAAGAADKTYFDFASSPNKRFFGWTDTWTTASNKCQAQYNDCLSQNKYTNAFSKCARYGSGW